MDYTPTQTRAINLKGDSLIVSAAAGAGKTAVLSERVMRILNDRQNPVAADRLMILTYTNAAATEMRVRITDALTKMVAKNPFDSYLKSQLMRLPCAKICTIDSMCLDIVRANFSKLSIDPQFSVAEENKLALMKNDELEDFLEQLYDRDDARDIINYFVRGRDDRPLFEALYNGSEFLLKQPWPESYINSLKDCDISTVFTAAPFFKNQLTGELRDIIDDYKTLCDTALNEKSLDMYSTELESITAVEKALQNSFDNAVKLANAVVFEWHPKRTNDIDKEQWTNCIDLRSSLKTRFLELKNKFLYSQSSVILSDRQKEIQLICSFFNLCHELNLRLWQKRKKHRILSFDDIEKLALKLLVKDDSGAPTQLAREISKNYDEIIVDEYQDCNKIQDCIFRALSKDNKNVFAVGDVKQSIYRFRNAEPELFIERLNNAVVPDSDTVTRPAKLSLRENFRSHPKILDFVNAVFDPVMTSSRGGIDYKSDHRLVSGGLYEKSESASVEMILCVHDSKPEISAAMFEAQTVAKKIKSIIGTQTVYDIKTQTERVIKASDIAIIMRAPRTSGTAFERALENEGIGYINNNPAENCLETPEVQDLLAYLQVIDNPYNDIPLVTLMYSDYFGFSANELGKIRALSRYTAFYDAVVLASQTDSKAKYFIEQIEQMRDLSQNTDVYGIISAVFEKSGVLIKLASEEGGDIKRANLLTVAEFASSFETGKYKGLFSFINYILRLKEKNNAVAAARLKKADDCVNILSIHGSKGLEYPVVFFVNTAAGMYKEHKSQILADNYLAGAIIRDDKTHREFPSLFYNVVEKSAKKQDIYEYMRLLYVALTRARARLYVTASMTAALAEKTIRAAHFANGNPTDYHLLESPSFFKWMLYSLITSKSCENFARFAGVPPKFNKELFDATLVFPDTEDIAIETKIQQPENKPIDATYVKQMLSKTYPHLSDTLVPAKLSVSEIKGIRQQEDSADVLIKQSPRALRPRFMSGAKATDKGNATHRFLQFCNFKSIIDMPSLTKEISRLVEYEFISKEDVSLIEKDKILRFLQSDIMQTLANAGTESKEERFVFTIPANEILNTDSTVPITVQGVLDCWYVVNGQAVIVDYKTDRVSDATELKRRYSVQLDMYSKALKHLIGIDTSHKYIYSFCLEQFIEID